MTFHINVREIGKKQWRFLSGNGTNRLRIHALNFETRDKAQALIDDNAADNPEWEWKVGQ